MPGWVICGPCSLGELERSIGSGNEELRQRLMEEWEDEDEEEDEEYRFFGNRSAKQVVDLFIDGKPEALDPVSAQVFMDLVACLAGGEPGEATFEIGHSKLRPWLTDILTTLGHPDYLEALINRPLAGFS